MSSRIIKFGFLTAVLLQITVPLGAKTRTYAVVVGNNSAPSGTGLKTLKYADDDAVRYYNFFKRFGAEVDLLTILDSRTQNRYPGAAGVSAVPTLDNLKQRIMRLQHRISRDRRNGDTVVLYFAYSGHGAHDTSGEPYLALVNGALTTGKLHETLAKVKADYTHLFIDACYAESVVGARGVFDDETNTEPIRITEKSLDLLTEDKTALSLPGLGVVVASSEYQKTHEWSRIESGVFTHEVLSALSGPADINMDGKIEYSELVAFISSANRKVADPRARIRVVARPPKRYHNIPIIDLKESKSSAFLVGDVSELGHFYIELESGERYLDANLGRSKSSYIMIPTEQRAYLINGDNEALINPKESDVILVVDLSFGKPTYRARGRIETAIQNGLFGEKYTSDYYKGFIDSTGFLGVKFGGAKLKLAQDFTVEKRERIRKGVAVAGIALAGSALVTATVSGILALNEKHSLNDTVSEKRAFEIDDRYFKYTSVFWPAISLVPVGILVGYVLWPKKKPPRKKKTEIRVGADSRMLWLNVEF